MNKKLKSPIFKILYYSLIILICIFAVFPFYWMVSISLKNHAQSYDPSVWFFKPIFDNYISIFKTRNISAYLKNSIIISVGTTLLSLFLGTLTAYGLAKYKFKKKEDVSFWLLSLRMSPAMAAVLPIFTIVSILRVFDNHFVLIITYMMFNIPFVVWMMRSFFEEIPKEIEESAKVDGCSNLQALVRVVLPMALPGLTATAIFCILQSWNEFVFALFLTAKAAPTLPTTVQNFLSVSGVVWGEMSAVGVVSSAPMIIFAIAVQKYMVRGLTFGAVKG